MDSASTRIVTSLQAATVIVLRDSLTNHVAQELAMRSFRFVNTMRHSIQGSEGDDIDDDAQTAGYSPILSLNTFTDSVIPTKHSQTRGVLCVHSQKLHGYSRVQILLSTRARLCCCFFEKQSVISIYLVLCLQGSERKAYWALAISRMSLYQEQNSYSTHGPCFSVEELRA